MASIWNPTVSSIASGTKNGSVWGTALRMTMAVRLRFVNRLIFGYTEDVSRFNYGFVHGSRTKIGNLIVGWNENSQTIAVVPTVPDLSGCGTPVFYRRSEILKAYRNKYPTDAFIIFRIKNSVKAASSSACSTYTYSFSSSSQS